VAKEAVDCRLCAGFQGIGQPCNRDGLRVVEERDVAGGWCPKYEAVEAAHRGCAEDCGRGGPEEAARILAGFIEGAQAYTAAETQGRKDDGGKPRWDLLPFAALEDVARVLEFGARKYAPDNWRKVEGWRWRYTRAGFGHLAAFARGEKLDPESGLPHLAHAACCLLFILDLDR
jgi:hypothetical protein